MDAVASTNPPFNPFVKIAIAGLFGAALLMMSSGCGHSDAAADFHGSPPQSISEPVKPVPTPPAPPTMPTTSSADNGDYASQKPGETRALPKFETPPPAPMTAAVIAPAAPAPAAAYAAAPASERDGKGRFHILQKGETLYAVARMYNVKPRAIIDANQFKDPNRVCVGTKVYIPD